MVGEDYGCSLDAARIVLRHSQPRAPNMTDVSNRGLCLTRKAEERGGLKMAFCILWRVTVGLIPQTLPWRGPHDRAVVARRSTASGHIATGERSEYVHVR
jgi:hypothetical protein